MADQNLSKKLERRAKSLLLNKEIPASKMEIVRSIMKDVTISQDERNRTIIDLVEGCPDKKVSHLPEGPVEVKGIPRKKNSASQNGNNSDVPEDFDASIAPTETSLYIEDLREDFKGFRLFKKRYLVHRNNKIGIGLRKRLIPTKRLLTIYREVFEFQEKFTDILSPVLMDILKDSAIEDPTQFNYLRQVRNWLSDAPFIKQSFETVKWMERKNFSRELTKYFNTYFSFLKLDADVREIIVLQFEHKLRESEDLRKEDILNNDTESIKNLKEKRNFEKEKKIYEYIKLIRSFLPNAPHEDNMVSTHIRKNYSIGGLTELLHISMEALVFQHHVKIEEIQKYYSVETPIVSSKDWNYSMDFLKSIGKDPDSKVDKVIEDLKEELEPFKLQDTIMRYTFNGENIIFRGIEDQWVMVDKKRLDLDAIYKENFFLFIDGMLQYFRNTFGPILNGSLINFENKNGEEFEGYLFNTRLFAETSASLESLLSELHHFRTTNPTLAVTRQEVVKIRKGQINTMNHVLNALNMVGDFFYQSGILFQQVYMLHKKWFDNGAKPVEKEILRTPLESLEFEAERFPEGRPLPYCDCTIKSFEESSRLSGLLSRREIISKNANDGILYHMMSFCFQASYESLNERILTDINRRRHIKKQIEDAEKKKRKR